MNDINPFAPIKPKDQLLNASFRRIPESEKADNGFSLNHLTGFEFSAELDVAYLNYFYQGDVEQASNMFDIFLNVTAKEFLNLEGLVCQKDWNAFRQLAHKMKPNFKMVGLTKLSLLLEKLEYLDKETSAMEELHSLVNSINATFKESLPLVVNERRLIGLALAIAV